MVFLPRHHEKSLSIERLYTEVTPFTLQPKNPILDVDISDIRVDDALTMPDVLITVITKLAVTVDGLQ
jgi:hypothetical protein